MELATPERARAAGFEPVLGWLPTMGVHWVNQSRTRDGTSMRLTAPDQLMFSPIDGKEVLVGAAYSFLTPLSQTARPSLFDGNPAWHDHPNLAPEGQTLAMLHVWFVPSPDGPFAGHNPNLPYWALGLTPPDETRMTDSLESARVRKVALALSVVVDTTGLFPLIQQRPEVHDLVATHREEIRKLMPKLDGTVGARDWVAWDRAADEAVSHWEAIRAAYLASARNPFANERMRRLMDEMETGAHSTPSHPH
jgi:hypothetical protein